MDERSARQTATLIVAAVIAVVVASGLAITTIWSLGNAPNFSGLLIAATVLAVATSLALLLSIRTPGPIGDESRERYDDRPTIAQLNRRPTAKV